MKRIGCVVGILFVGAVLGQVVATLTPSDRNERTGCYRPGDSGMADLFLADSPWMALDIEVPNNAFLGIRDAQRNDSSNVCETMSANWVSLTADLAFLNVERYATDQHAAAAFSSGRSYGVEPDFLDRVGTHWETEVNDASESPVVDVVYVERCLVLVATVRQHGDRDAIFLPFLVPLADAVCPDAA